MFECYVSVGTLKAELVHLVDGEGRHSQAGYLLPVWNAVDSFFSLIQIEAGLGRNASKTFHKKQQDR